MLCPGLFKYGSSAFRATVRYNANRVLCMEIAALGWAWLKDVSAGRRIPNGPERWRKTLSTLYDHGDNTGIVLIRRTRSILLVLVSIHLWGAVGD